MNEVEALQLEAAVPAQVTSSAGQLLRQARERQGVSLESLAGMLKVPVDKLAALEAEDWRKLPDAVFARALAQTVCRTLQVDASPVLALLPKGGAAKLSANPEGLNTPFKDKAMRSSVAGQSEAVGSGLWKLLALGLLAAAGAAGVYWGTDWVKGPAEEVASSAAVHSPAAAVGVPVAVSPNAVAVPVQPSFANGVASVPVTPLTASTEAAVVAPVPAPAVVPAQPSAAAAVVPQAAPVQAPVQSAGATAPLVAAPPVASPQAATSAVGAPVTVTEVAAPTLRMRASAQTWVQVRDAQQRVVLEQILQAGGVAETSAARPLFVVVGKADATTVEVDGAALDLAAVARNNVARFEVK